ncbi:MAG: dihydrofolate reductase family protein [Alistipes sp.]|nr:dihydrofolate reductase family protein [Alistipes sp.]
MQVTLSFARSADGYLDDQTPERLILSTEADWAAVHRLRSEQEAILVGAETVRRDNPSLKGVPVRVTVTRSGDLSPESRFFTVGDARRIVFSTQPLPRLDGLAEVILSPVPITAARIVTELERRGITRLMVEGGAEILALFVEEGLADVVREAINPTITVGEALGGAHYCFTPSNGIDPEEELLDGMEVRTYRLKPDRSTEDCAALSEAIAVSRNCPISQSCYRVGALIITPSGERFTGYTHESSATHHAEQEAVIKAEAAGVSLRGATIYTSMEPCSKRASEPESCTQLILRHGFARVVFACYEPACFVCCEGAYTLRRAGVEVAVYPALSEKVLQINKHLF